MERTLVITGKGKLDLKPDLVIIRFPLENRNYHYATAVEGLNNVVSSLRNSIASLGMDPKELKTLDFSVDTHTQWNKNREITEFIGFKAKHDLQLEFPLDNALINRIVNKILELKMKIEFKINFGIQDQESCVHLLIENAVKNAKEKAELLSKASGVELKEIVNINYAFTDIHFHSDTDFNYNYEPSINSMSMPDINPTDLRLSENVTITWKIE